MTLELNFCQGLKSEHGVLLGDGSSGKSFYAMHNILQNLPPSYKIWTWDDTHTAFTGIGTAVRSLNNLLDANVQYLPQERTKEEMIKFMQIAFRLGDRVVVLDEFHKYQKSKSIHPEIEYFLKTAKHRNISWLAIAQSPLEIHDAVYHNIKHIFAFYMKPTSRHIKSYYEWFTKPLTTKLKELYYEVDGTNTKRPYIYLGSNSREPILYSHKGRFVIREDAKGNQLVTAVPKGAKI